MLFVAALLVAASFAGDALAGGVAGTVKYEGTVPNLRPVKMDADPGCAKKHSGPVKPEILVLGEGQTMANIFVHVKSGLPAKQHAAPSTALTLNQDGCTYVPHVLGIMVGQKLEILNSDGLLHNVHALPKINKGFNRAMPASVTSAEYTFDKPEFMFKIKCDVHPWMGAYVAVMEHPYFSVTGKDGKFSIEGLPAGTYEVEAWHEKLGTQTFKVTIAGDETQTQEVVFSKP